MSEKRADQRYMHLKREARDRTLGMDLSEIIEFTELARELGFSTKMPVKVETSWRGQVKALEVMVPLSDR